MSTKEVISNLSSLFIFGAGIIIPFFISNKIENVRSIRSNTSKLKAFLMIIISDINVNLDIISCINSSLGRFAKLKAEVSRKGCGRSNYLQSRRKKQLVNTIIKNIKFLRKIDFSFLNNYTDNELISDIYFNLYKYNNTIDDLKDLVCDIEKENLKDSEVLNFINLISPFFENTRSMLKNIENISEENSRYLVKLNKHYNLAMCFLKFLSFLMIAFILIEVIGFISIKINLLSNPLFLFSYYGVTIFSLFFLIVISIIFGLKR